MIATADQRAHSFTKEPQRKIVAVSIEKFLAHDLPAREVLFSPWLVSQSLNMVYAWRGVGKTHFALNVGYALASGGEFLRWKAKKPRKVLYIDGEMPGAAMQKRLAEIVKAADKSPEPGMLNIVTPDMQPDFQPIPDLATAEGQAAIDQVKRRDWGGDHLRRQPELSRPWRRQGERVRELAPSARLGAQAAGQGSERGVRSPRRQERRAAGHLEARGRARHLDPPEAAARLLPDRGGVF
jgi:hypothetical protein